ncbi:MAG: hypothetical protein CVU42_01875 [Chloroflexi bacterium HGW-Chloroflexi-4]|nr:MAG: hypothetical protein CVU42_01875 [Chloroflexi bacterium HGW-Chloroflexi-4]
MNKRFTTVSILIVILIMLSAACSLGKKTPSPLGEEYRSEIGGFTISKINGYNFEDAIGIVNMTAPDGSIETGPGVMVMGGIMEQELTNEDLLETMKTQATTIEVGKAKKTKVDGVNGLLADLSGEYNGVEIKGKIFVAMFTPKQEFIMMALSPEENWKELEPIYDELLDSVTFFEASTSSAITTENNEAPIQVNEEPQLIRQWASEAYAESEYSSTDWSASQATGAPNVDSCGDNSFAWASSSSSGTDSIELIYDIPVSPTEINIYQSYNPSQVVEVDIIDLNGEAWIAWSGEPEYVENCPDLMTITLELDDPLYIDRVVVYIDQSVLQTGYNEIDAVELVGMTMAGQSITSSNPDPNSSTSVEETAIAVNDNLPVPTNYSGWMADDVYQGWINIIVNETKVKDLDKIMTIKGVKSTENWKPRPDHADTFIYEMGPVGMKGYISVTTDGIVYKKSLSSNTYPDDFGLATVTRATYEQLDAIYQQDYVIPYAVMANILQSPGFLREQYFRTDDNKMVAIYEWLAPNGDRISGAFYNGLLTGMAGLAYIPAE